LTFYNVSCIASDKYNRKRLFTINGDCLNRGVFERFGNRVSIYHANFSQIGEVLEAEGIEKVNGVLFDLGVSHFHLRGNRGFTVWEEQPLDMRMDRRQKLTAKDVVNELSEKELADIIFKYGEEKFARKIAREMVRRRKIKPIETTLELAKIVEEVIPKKLWAGRKKHPAIKTFQAIRIYVNREFQEIEEGIPEAANHVTCSGRIVIITFHSLEDRLVKNILRNLEGFKVITKKPVEPTEEEITENPASRSAKLRAVERICE